MIDNVTIRCRAECVYGPIEINLYAKECQYTEEKPTKVKQSAATFSKNIRIPKGHKSHDRFL